MKKILKSCLIIFMIVLISYAVLDMHIVRAGEENFNLDIHEGDGEASFNNAVSSVTGTVLAVLRYAGMGIAMISLVLIAIKYLSASPGEKADYKKNLVVFAVGGIGMFAAGTIVDILMQVSDKIKAA